MNIEIPFKVKCIDDDSSGLTLGKEYEVITVEGGFYTIENDSGVLQSYFPERFEILDRKSNPKDKQEFSVGDKVVINKISDDFVTGQDKSVKVGDVATVTIVGGCGNYDVRLSNPNWNNAWWFSRNDLSLAEGENLLDDNLLSHQEVIQAIIDGKEVEIQYTDGTWNRMLSTITTLRQLVNLNFRLKPEPRLEYKRRAIIKKLLTTKVAVLCKCWCNYECGSEIVAITSVDDGCTYPYVSNDLNYKNAYAIDDNGNEITNV